jgi:muramidase (phage lysozyme)
MDVTVPAGAAILLDFIYRTDAGAPPPKCYETIFGNRQNRLARPITKMTLGDLIDAQKNWSSKAWVKANWGYATASSASGAAQFMRDTLIGLAKELSLSGNQVFDPNLQDRLAYHLLKRRGYEDFMAGKISRTEFGKRLAQEWASFPVLASTKGAHRQVPRGSSYYMGDKLNKSLVTPEKVESVLDEVLTLRPLSTGPVSGPPPLGTPIPGTKPYVEPIAPPVPPVAKPKPAPRQRLSLIEIIVAAFAWLFPGRKQS